MSTQPRRPCLPMNFAPPCTAAARETINFQAQRAERTASSTASATSALTKGRLTNKNVLRSEFWSDEPLGKR